MKYRGSLQPYNFTKILHHIHDSKKDTEEKKTHEHYIDLT